MWQLGWPGVLAFNFVNSMDSNQERQIKVNVHISSMPIFNQSTESTKSGWIYSTIMPRKEKE
jgi:hypothetical protein